MSLCNMVSHKKEWSQHMYVFPRGRKITKNIAAVHTKLVEIQKEKHWFISVAFDMCDHLMLSISHDGFSKYSFHLLENRAICAPSITRWSADQLTFII